MSTLFRDFGAGVASRALRGLGAQRREPAPRDVIAKKVRRRGGPRPTATPSKGCRIGVMHEDASVIIRYPPRGHSDQFSYSAKLIDKVTIVFDCSPEAFHGYIVRPSPFAVHADFYASFLRSLNPCFRCILAALVCIKNLRFSTRIEGSLQCTQTQ